jgi:hypothetical protein
MRNLVIIALLSTCSPTIAAQTQHQARDWYCVRQPFAQTTEGNVVALQCVAALPKGEKLDDEDEDALGKLDRIRSNVQSFTGKDQNMMDATRMGFGQKVGQICQRHPNIVLAPLFPDLTSGTTTLYGCKNIIAAPEK